MNRARLEELIRVLEAIDPAHFDMRVWYSHKHTCGSAGCAFGYAALHESFIEQGLCAHLSHTGQILGISFQGHQDFMAAAAFFEISVNEAHNLFYAGDYHPPFGKYLKSSDITPQAVIGRIRELLTREE